MATPDEIEDPKVRFERARDLFDQAWSLAPDQRESFVLGRTRGDRELAKEVMRLLARANQAEGDAAHDGASDDDGDDDTNVDVVLDDNMQPRHIGRYRILSTLGEGGMGTVYLAEQREPMRRRVALKVLKRGMDSKAFLSRFEAERQALAMMEHSCIARVYDAGVSDSGQPFLAMEYVKGVPITTYCDDNKLSIADRVELFVAVCSAIQHAHTKGVMHRDLKPSNILVTVQDGRPEPKVIDFGLAKAVDHRLVESTVFTEAGQIIGTPEYMSPEQAGVGGLDIDTRTDVYSLGVLLYQLLTGTLPVTREELLRHGYLEMQRVIREDEMVKPSTKVTTLGEGAEVYAKARRLPLGELQKQLRGELDWIVMKAIEKDRGRRYTTVHELAADLLRHQRDEPVSAGPPSLSYLLRKLAKRHRGAVLAGAGMVVALGAGLWVAVWQWREAAAQAEIARDNAAKAEAAGAIAAAERDRANENFARYKSLEDTGRLRLFVLKAADVWREVPAAVPAMQAWVDEVEAWLANLPDHGKTLAELRARGRESGRGVRFDDVGDQFLHDALAEFVRDRANFVAPTGAFGQVKASLDWSRQVLQETVLDHEAQWRDVNSRLRVHPDFGGLVLAGQPGLVPLGRDPDSQLEMFWWKRSGEAPVLAADGRVTVTPEMGIVLVLLPGGKFLMGSESGSLGDVNEQPLHEVELSPFFLAKYELTQSQWRRWTGDNPSKSQQADRGHHPVETVALDEVNALVRRFGLTLPTEAQWEYACRAGTRSEWSLGRREDLIDPRGRGLINIADGYIARAEKKQFVPDAVFWPEFNDGCVLHTRVGFYVPNAFGLFDLHGNVAEFTRGPATNGYAGVEHAAGDGLILGADTDRAIQRGGSYWKRVEDSRSACRILVARDARYDNVGFRVARAIDP